MTKPTQPFGSLVFSADGRVRKRIETLPDTKEGQEAGVAERFARYATEYAGPIEGWEALPESDHDFILKRIIGRAVQVQCTEIVAREFLLPEGAKSDYQVVVAPGVQLPVHSGRLLAALTIAIARKLKKHYAKPAADELWLLIYSVSGFLFGNFVEGGQTKVSEQVQMARALLEIVSPGPFDRIIYFDLMTRPTQVWPPVEVDE